jgi:uncharacterized membrane protein
MATIQQSIEVLVPVHAAYHQLTQFKDYPRFMQYVEAVEQLDATHLHWSTRLPHQSMEWDSEITELQPDRCIAWRNANGPTSSGKVELQPTSAGTARVTLTMECDPLQLVPEQDGNADTELERRIGQDLERFKKLVETPGLHPDSAAGTSGTAVVADSSGAAVGKTIGQSAAEQRESNQAPAPAASSANAQPSSMPAAGYAAGGEGWSGDEDPQQPVISASNQVAQPPADGSAATSADRSSLSDNSLSQLSADPNTEGQFNVAEEQSFDQQSEQARRVGQLPGADDANDDSDLDPASVLAQALQPDPDQEAQDPHGRKPEAKRPGSPSA